MPIDIVVPELGESITEATIAVWLKQPGDFVAADEPLCELETDKATLEMPSPKAGVLSEIVVAEGEDVEVGALIARLDESATPGPPAPVTDAAPAATPEAPSASPAAPGEEAPAASPSASAKEATGAELPDPARVGRSGQGGAVSAGDLQHALGIALEQQGPAVRRLLEEQGLDPARIPASGRDGRLTKEDVLAFLESPPAVAPASEVASVPASAAAGPREERVKMSRMRRTIATRLKEAQNTAAILTTFNEADMSAVMDLRRRYRDPFEEKHGVRLGFTSFFAKACVAALKEIPAVNAEIDGDDVVYKYHYDLGMAVSSPAGLVVPVIRDCDDKSMARIEAELGELAGKARDGTLTVEEMSGGTFSITNGGVFGSMMSTPILNRPQSAILGLHKIQERPVAVDGNVAIRPMMYLALSYDHRIIDGREAVTFLVKVKEAIEDPERLLLEV